MKFIKAKRRFDVTARVMSKLNGQWVSILDRTIVVWSSGPELNNMLDPICDAAGRNKADCLVSILYIREHEFHEYTPAQMGKMMAQEGVTDFMQNPYTDKRSADLWIEAFRSELDYQARRR